MNRVTPILIIISIAADSCSDKNSPAVTIVSPSENEEVSGTIMVKVVASDDEKMDRVELYVDDELLSSIAGDKDIYTFFGDTDVRENGVVSLFAKAYDEAGNSKKSDIVNLMVINNTTIKFWNISWDDIYFSFHTTETVLIFLDSIEVKVPNNSGETHFTGSSGRSCGSIVSWDFYIDVGLGDDGYSLSVGPEWFYLFVSNQGTVDINDTYVNQGLALATDSCFTTIPNNDYIYPLGYYQALTNSNVYCYLLNHPQYDYVYWGPIVFPGEISQFFWAQTGLFKSMDITVQNIVEPPFERVSESAQGVVSKGYLPMRAVPFDLGRLSRE